MNEQRDLERRVSDWLEEEARGELPDWALEETLERARTEPQQVTLRARLALLRPSTRRLDEPLARKGFTMFTAMRAAVLALLLGITSLGLVLVAVDDDVTPAAPSLTESLEIEKAASMLKGRSGHEATLLPDGRVLISGGGWAETEVFDAQSGSFALNGKASGIRTSTASLLEDGRVLIAGGGGTGAEILDAANGTVEPTGDMLVERELHSATVLADGRVLFAGGRTASAELYDPASGEFNLTGDMGSARAGHVATLLPDGRVLISGGGQPFAEVYEPESGTFMSSAAGLRSREHHSATLLTDGRVLLAGDGADAQIYDPETDTAHAVGQLNVPRYHHAATLLADGRVLFSGGMDLRESNPVASMEVFDFPTGSFAEVGTTVPRWENTATLLPDGTVLIAGGTAGPSASRVAELAYFTP